MKYRAEEIAIACAIMIAVAFVAMTCNGCSAAEQAAFRDTMKPLVKVTCAVARRVVAACPLVEGAVGVEEETSGGEEE